MTTIDSLQQFLEAQLEASGRRLREPKSMRVAPVIAITREPGCNGESVARILAHELGLVLYDWEILEKIAKDAQVSERAVATLDGALRSELDEWLADLSGGSSLSSYHYMQSLRRVLFTVASHGNAVILGRGANFLLPPGKKALGLCLVAPLEARVRNVMVELSLSEELARKHIARAERDQRLWVKRNCHADVNDATCYHLVVNTALVAEGMIVRLVKEMIVANE